MTLTAPVDPGRQAAHPADADHELDRAEFESGSGFQVTLANFEGPFDLLLRLISRRKLDVTEVALSHVTDEFLAYLTAARVWDLGEVTEFLVVASTLLDLKAARLLPTAEVEDDEDLALLEARDLLFARLLQYRAYKLAAAHLGELERRQWLRQPRVAELEPRYAALVPDVLVGIDAAALAEIAQSMSAVKPSPVVTLDHVHAPRVSVHEHMVIVSDRLRRHGALTFRALAADCDSTLAVVARFLALLELYRDGVAAFDQVAAFGELRIRWIKTIDANASACDVAGGERRIDEDYG